MKFVQAKYYTEGRHGRRPLWIVVHTTEGGEGPTSAEDVAAWFARGERRSSAHFCVDPNSVVCCVQSVDTAWHVPGRFRGVSVNTLSIGLEHCATARQTVAQWADEASTQELQRGADLAAILCRKWGIPIVRLRRDELRRGLPGITGHHDMSEAFHPGGHWDPGPNFPWQRYLGWMEAASPVGMEDIP